MAHPAHPRLRPRHLPAERHARHHLGGRLPFRGPCRHRSETGFYSAARAHRRHQARRGDGPDGGKRAHPRPQPGRTDLRREGRHPRPDGQGEFPSAGRAHPGEMDGGRHRDHGNQPRDHPAWRLDSPGHSAPRACCA